MSTLRSRIRDRLPKIMLYVVLIGVPLFLAFGPLLFQSSANLFVVCLVALITCIVGWVLLMPGEIELIGPGFSLIVAAFLISIITLCAGEKSFGRSALVYQPASGEAVIEARGAWSFYPQWRMQNRTIYRNAEDGVGGFVAAPHTEQHSYVSPEGWVVDVNVSFEYSIPDEVILAHHRDGAELDYQQEVSRAVERALIITLASAPPDARDLSQRLRSEIKTQTSHLSDPITYLKVVSSFSGQKVTVSSKV